MFKILLLFSLFLVMQPSYADYIKMTNNAPNYMGINSLKQNYSTVGNDSTDKIRNRYLARKKTSKEKPI